ncbi:transcription termination/antitermination protein NusG (plasmid) [Tundrisphaera lichenicola]|uniref:transcription termination/antitermination protein NusG n=1 Tax=Tundrisphaera lichenicola TaxID=2029860 RepID=UPI003EBD9939
MPILPSEPEVYPPDLWASEGPRFELESEDGRRWHCLHVKPRQEKSAARHLLERRVPFYLPMAIKEGRTPGGRKIRSQVPLFTGYLFLLGDDLARLEAYRTDCLVNCLEVGDQEGLERDLRQIHRVLGSGLPVVPEPSHPVGSKIRILGGPLMGLVGTVIRRDGKDHFTAVVRFLGRGVSVALQDWQIEGFEGN